MFRKALLAVTFVAVSGSLAVAQEHRVELSSTAGWTFSDGVSGETPIARARRRDPTTRVDPKDAFSWGTPTSASWSERERRGGRPLQPAVDEPGGLHGTNNGDARRPEESYNYHGYLAYNFGDQDRSTGSPLRPRRAGRDAVQRKQSAHTSAPQQKDIGGQHPVLDHLGGWA